MLAQRRYEVVRPVTCRSRRRKQRSLIQAIVSNRMVCVLLLALAASLVLSVYVGAYARATERGYRRAQLMSHLREVRLENESLRVDLDGLRKPDCIAQFAVENGMEQSQQMAYIGPAERPHLARNTGDGSAR